jgi:lysozyme family protein
MTVRFQTALAHVIKWEGGFVDHPDDPGGATNHGITLATLRAWRGEAVTAQDVRELSRDEAAAIYRARYWDRCRCGEMPAGLDLLVFDGAVNHGPGQSVRMLQQALGVAADGLIGPQTLGAAGRADARAAITETAARRMVFYGGLPTFGTFGLGWSRRLMDTVRAGLGLPASLAA